MIDVPTGLPELHAGHSKSWHAARLPRSAALSR